MQRSATIAALILTALFVPIWASAQSFDSGLRVVGTVQPKPAILSKAKDSSLPVVDNVPDLKTAGPILLAPPGLDGAESAAAISSFVHNSPLRVKPFPIVMNRIVQRYVDAMLAHPAGLTESFRRSRPFMPEMVHVLEREGLPRDLIYLAFAESGFSPAGAGPWQLSKATARRFGLIVDGSIDERRDPIMSTRAAAEYLATLHDQTDDWNIVLVGWNRGEGALDRFGSLRGANYQLLIDSVPGATRSLLNRFMAVAVIAHNAREYGLQAVTFTTQRPFYQRVEVKGGTSLKSIAERYNTSASWLRHLNPALLHDSVPTRVPSLELRVPNQQFHLVSLNSDS